ncbi:MAG: MoaD/ThiS family protein [Crenarchaeota archaeon]|nr:MoaD/ThiS family protein [Thermoproteota archaeon]MCR8453754.1 MoaD/ThiS family protein [Thermoproteota archaeon]MCR8455465.1 MoaD/ThiS family protein [Thermoproteota archaeon]MCR8463286.1 MoaD/ThiS family protein [Thermoproteota archaeon]MCR8470887.1 MoaD/ThiS family protein [Thermoproteota archaeon]
MVTVIFYGDIKQRAGTEKVEIRGNRPLIEILTEISERFNAKDLIFREGRVRGELLIIVNGSDWNSLGLLDKPVGDDATVKLVPIWHGG